MDPSEAARLLGVADSEVRDIRPAGDWWEVLHHDMASHEETWRAVPGRPELASGGIVRGPVLVGESGPEEVKPAAKRRSAR